LKNLENSLESDPQGKQQFFEVRKGRRESIGSRNVLIVLLLFASGYPAPDDSSDVILACNIVLSPRSGRYCGKRRDGQRCKGAEDTRIPSTKKNKINIRNGACYGVAKILIIEDEEKIARLFKWNLVLKAMKSRRP
jgi:hypothetical protein